MHKGRIKELVIYNSKRRGWVGLLYILPWLLGFSIFQIYPLITSLIYSFTNYSFFNDPSFTGLENFRYAFTRDIDFWPSMKATILYVLMGVPGKLIFALFIAMILNMKMKAINLFRTIYYIPSILGSSVAVAIVWRLMFMRNGTVNRFLAFLHLPQVDWLGSPFAALVCLALLIVWQFGSSMVIFLAGLKQIPRELYEAAIVDGSSAVTRFFHITLPLLTPIIFFNLVMQIIAAFQDFTSAFVITNGGPMKGTYLYGMKLYTDAFSYFKLGYACALSWILYCLIIFITIVLFRTSDKWVFYYYGGKIL